jgi:hypothetical protein
MLYICTYSPWPALAEIHSSSLALNVFTFLHTCVLIVVTPDIEHSAVLLTWRQLIKARNKDVAEVQNVQNSVDTLVISPFNSFIRAAAGF